MKIIFRSAIYFLIFIGCINTSEKRNSVIDSKNFKTNQIKTLGEIGSIFENNLEATSHYTKISAGLFAVDAHKSFYPAIWQIVSRFTFEFKQTLLGYVCAQLATVFNRVESVTWIAGSTVIIHSKNSFGDEWGMTLGCFIQCGNKITPLRNSWPLQHEYGHYLQSRYAGSLYFMRYAIPSAFSAWRDLYDLNYKHYEYFSEKSATNLGMNYFKSK